ncbi:MAG TPA: phosphopantetheine-binding protein [Burkholderiales bacterium]|nr:phosphopantetheine-binding protein [Burkholderiales bacterium]
MDKFPMEMAQPDADLTAHEFELAQMIVATLALDMRAKDIAPTMPLFGDGLGLDSIDVLEIALAISRQYGVKLRSDDEESPKIFGSLRSLNQHIQTHRTR